MAVPHPWGASRAQVRWLIQYPATYCATVLWASHVPPAQRVPPSAYAKCIYTMALSIAHTLSYANGPHAQARNTRLSIFFKLFMSVGLFPTLNIVCTLKMVQIGWELVKWQGFFWIFRKFSKILENFRKFSNKGSVLGRRGVRNPHFVGIGRRPCWSRIRFQKLLRTPVD